MDAYLKHTIVSGDEIKSLAQHYLGDASQWVNIVILNQLSYPFIIDGLRPKDNTDSVKYIGEKLLIPISSADDQADLSANGFNLYPFELQSDYDLLLGTDYNLFSTETSGIELSSGQVGELSVNHTGDLKTVSGVNNLKQAIIIKFATPYGSLTHHPDFGSHITEYIGKTGSIETLQNMQDECTRTVLTDGRVEDVNFPVFNYDSSLKTLAISMQLTPISIDQIINMSAVLDQGGVVSWD